MLSATKISASRASLWARLRLQLGGALALVTAIFLIRWQVSTVYQGEEAVGLAASFIGTVLALISGYFAFRRLTNFPGSRMANQIIPIFTMTFGTVLVFFFFFRLDYSRLQFIAGYLGTIGWFYLVYFQLRRQRLLRFGVVPFGAVDQLFPIPTISWVRLKSVGRTPENLDGIVADLRADIPPEWERFLSDSALAGTLVMHAKQMEESLTGRVQLEHLSENNFGSLIPGVVYGKIKRVVDLVLSFAMLPVLVPIILITMLLIKADSPGPAVFRQQRMGYRGVPFTMFKLRSMKVCSRDGEDARNGAMTQANDDRVTRLGRFIRRYRIDELPQVINVIKGEMSWIGPRPEAVQLSEWYESELPFYRYRHIVRPGITGWAQVRLGHVAEVNEVMEKLHYDFYYIRNFSFWLDVLIVAATARTVVDGFGAR